MVAFMGPSRGNSEIIIGCILSAAAMARFGCLAIWLAWGQSRVVWRLPMVLLNIVVSVAIWTAGSNSHNEMQFFLFFVLGVSVIAAIPRLFRVHRVNLKDPPGYLATREVRGGQFRLTDMFAWTATAALLMGIVRWVGVPQEWEWLALILALPVAGILVLVAMWATLTRAVSIHVRVLSALLLTVGIATVLTMLMGGQGDVALIINGTLLMTVLMTIGCLYVVRCLGVRLVLPSPPIWAARVGVNSSALSITGPQNKQAQKDKSSGLE